MSKQMIEIYQKFEKKWVAFNSDKTQVVASGDSLIDVENQVLKNNVSASEIRYILPLNKYFAPLCQ